MFKSPLDLRCYTAHEWVVLQDMNWLTPPGSPEPATVRVPRGFITDLASIPRPLRGALDINGLSRKPAVLHDFLYCTQPCTRAEADATFRRALQAEGVNLVVRNTYYWGVRLGGALYWKKRADRQELTQDDFVTATYWETPP